MTNEELAVRIRAGETEHLLELWENCQQALRILASRYHASRIHHAHVDLEDLLQCGYLAMIEAVKGYRPDRGTRFTTFLKLTYRNEMHRIFGARISHSGDRAKWIFPYAPDSLDVPRYEDGDDLVDLLQDDQDIEYICEQLEIRETVAAAIRRLEPGEQLVIRGMYFACRRRQDLVDGQVICTFQDVLKHERRAMSRLRRDPELRALYLAHYYNPKLPSMEHGTPEKVVLAGEDMADWMQELFNEMEA